MSIFEQLEHRKYLLKVKLQHLLEEHPKVNYFQRVIRHMNDCDFVNKVLLLGHNPNGFYMKSYGEKNIDKNILFIEINAMMGYAYRYMLYALFEAECLGFTPVIRFNEKCAYLENHPINGTQNPFEYYFQQPADVSLESVYESKRVFPFDMSHLARIEKDLGNLNPETPVGYVVTEDYLNVLAQIARKHLKLNAVTERKIMEGIKNLFPKDFREKRILGVHVRGTDFALNWENHPNMVMPEEFFSVTDKLLQGESAFDYIFLATDDSTRLDAFKERYGAKLLYYTDVHREAGKKNIALCSVERENTHYLDGLEVLRDMYTLAECNGLIAGLSQISIAARIVRLARKGAFEYMKILDKGIYQG